MIIVSVFGDFIEKAVNGFSNTFNRMCESFSSLPSYVYLLLTVPLLLKVVFMVKERISKSSEDDKNES